ncbi:MAG: hypothetical protein LBG30_01230 [Odoribacteraceae bacterium]|jgi:hypothetical protein|nr:hypothetical protein [Odoribacteraceae bacterium]
MKTTRALLVALAIAAACSCAREAAIVPEGPDALLNAIPFPQGNDPWDEVFQQIDQQHGVKIYYKNFTDADWSRSWTNAAGAPLAGERFETPEELAAAAAYVKQYIFDFLDPTLLRGVFRPRVYLVKNMHLANIPQALSIGMDCWIFSPPLTNATDYSTGVYASKLAILSAILHRAYAGGNIALPPAFFEGVDYATPTDGYSRAASNNNWPNLWSRRGFLSDLGDAGLPFFPDYYPTLNVSPADFQAHPDLEFRAFVNYILILRDRDRYFADGARFEQCTLLRRRFQILEEHLKTAYGIDLLAYQSMAFDGYSGAEWDDARCVPVIPR